MGGENPKERIILVLGPNFFTSPGATGWAVTVADGVVIWLAIGRCRRAHFGWFWYTHHLFIIFFTCWQLYGKSLIPVAPNAPGTPSAPFGSTGLIGIYQPILREVRSCYRTYISKVMEIQIKKEKTKVRAGQYVFLKCPEVSYFQWHPFKSTSAPEEDYISVHIRIVSDFMGALTKSLGCDFDSEKGKKGDDEKGEKVIETVTNPSLNRVCHVSWWTDETVLLVGAGIGITPFASILKSIWYRMNNMNNSKPNHLSKVYFVWVIRDSGSAAWFHSLLHAVEEQDVGGGIEISIYLTAELKDDDVNNQDVSAEKMRLPVRELLRTSEGRTGIGCSAGLLRGIRRPTSAYSSAVHLSSPEQRMSKNYTDPKGTKFFFGKENP
ncbi:hypothetical protein M407DRAFT_28298 [Tulasnella calospora MUT 4182]|uniref:FAD-binding FR-type domain-containing protein n=1 Tax=Tulasnella calospora MUT 4182 TaxID=1051891 RepID=A0A0C3QAY1_9AGAM|nr:hypothetical protein M407DRAFT_28298 [Tulasnella calospora MUT 4182]